MDTRTEANLNQLAGDVHFVTAPLRFIWHAVLVTLFILSFPLLCALLSLHYVIGNVNLVWAYCHFMSTHHIPDALYPFVLLGGLAMLAVQAMVGAVQVGAEIFDFIWRWQPLFGITFLALVNSACPRRNALNLPQAVRTRIRAARFFVNTKGNFALCPLRATVRGSRRNPLRPRNI